MREFINFRLKSDQPFDPLLILRACQPIINCQFTQSQAKTGEQCPSIQCGQISFTRNINV